MEPELYKQMFNHIENKLKKILGDNIENSECTLEKTEDEDQR